MQKIHRTLRKTLYLSLNEPVRQRFVTHIQMVVNEDGCLGSQPFNVLYNINF